LSSIATMSASSAGGTSVLSVAGAGGWSWTIWYITAISEPDLNGFRPVAIS